MCIAEKEKGGPRRCPAGATKRVQAAQHVLDRQQTILDSLSADLVELDSDAQLLEDMRLALSGEMTAERERELIAGAQQHLATLDDDDDFEDWATQFDDAPDPTTEDYIDMARCAWDDVQSSIQIVPTAEDTARYLDAVTRYETSLEIVGQCLADDADAVADDRIRSEGVQRRPVSGDELRAVRREYLNAAHGSAQRDDLRVRMTTLADDALCDGPRSRRRAEIRAAAYREAISKVRMLGGASQTLTGRPRQDMREQMAQVTADMPADWVRAASKQPLALQRRKDARGYYDPAGSTIQTGGNVATMYHEYAHHVEVSNMQIYLATNAFLRRRTTGEDGKPMPADKYGPRGSGELVIPDGFVDKYVGKQYSHSSTEVFSMGTEALFCGKHGGLVGDQHDSRSDAEHRNLILGLWATARSDTYMEG